MIRVRHQGKTFPLEEKYPIEFEYEGMLYILMVTKSKKLSLQKPNYMGNRKLK